MTYLNRTLKIGDEEPVLRLYRRYLGSFLGKFGLSFLLAGGAIFFVYPFFSWGKWGIVLFWFILLAGLILFSRTLIMWYFDALILTRGRVILSRQLGFFHREVAEITWDKIHGVSYLSHGLMPTLFKYGTVMVSTTGGSALRADFIRNPGSCQKFITEFLADRQYLDSDDGALSKLNIRTAGVKYLLDDEVEQVLTSFADGLGRPRLKKLLERFLNRL